ncbi:hypothetical protein HZU83_06335 [Sphaerotilus montanus]|uniref:Uncharacterized protein n=1 Tax=Sphaerotilus montanus TaxID=522889 RepID=A0A7Y9QX33_9BURK|nr:hypothetical protein [Sphaerotilus montanus]NYG32506.1 hypothetical protein [Sphaerotilus montanus]NZD56293.1 hypothetical protein [Sphaerotilus montanus]
MKLQKELQRADVSDAARSRIALALPVLKGILLALQRDRVSRLGGYEKITLADLAREYREGSGDCGICFEYAVHDSLLAKDPNIHALLSNVLNDFCTIKSGAESILFGAEKSGGISLIDTSDSLLNDDSRILSGKVGQPTKLKKQWDTIKKALRDTKARDRLPTSIKGLWKADLFLGNSSEGKWVGSTLKLNKSDFQGAAGLRLGIYPETKKGESPSRDDKNNLILCPLPYDANFMEVFYSSFFAVKQFLLADAKVPRPVALPNSADRFLAQQFEDRREFTVLEIIEYMYPLGQPDLTTESVIGASSGDASVPLDAVAPVPRSAA